MSVGDPAPYGLLGPLEVHADGRRVALGGRRERTLLAMLLLNANREIGVDRLVDAIWGDRPPTNPRAALHNVVSRLRARLAPDAVSRTGSGYILRLEPGDLDLARVEELGREATSARTANRLHASVGLLRDALAHWRGEALSEFAGEPFAGAEAGRIAELRLHLLEERIALELELGRHDDLVGELEALVAEHPLRERFRAQLMLALYRSGRQSEALDAYQSARRVLSDELGLEPGPELRQIERAVLNQDVLLDAPAAPPVAAAAVPAPVSPLVGRDDERRAVLELLRRPAVRAVTLTGPGGVGKTRLAVELAGELHEDVAGSVCFVSLEAVAEPSLIVPAVAQALGLEDAGRTDLLESVLGVLQARDVLLVVDNVEQLLPDGAVELARLLEAARGLRLLATSRAPLRVAGEYEYPVEPLPLPDLRPPLDVERLAQSDAVVLFLSRMEAVRPGHLPPDELLAVASICVRLDGLPLALELVAIQTRLFSPRALLSRLENRLPLPSATRHGSGRQQTLASTIEWSYALLGEGAQRRFLELAVFSGGWGLEAAAAVAGVPAEELLDQLAELLDHHLVRRDDSVDGEPRFSMLATIREVALRLLESGGDATTVRRRHTEYYAGLAEQAAVALVGPDQARWLEQLELEHDNVRAAIAWPLEHGDAATALQIGGALARYFYVRGYLGEGRRWLEEALAGAATAPAEVRARGLTAAANVARFQGDHGAALRHANENLQLSRRLGDPPALINSLMCLANVESERGATEAEQLYEEARAEATRAGEPWLEAQAWLGLAGHALLGGEYARAARLYRTSLDLLSEVGDRTGAMVALHSLGFAALHRGRYDEARLHLVDGLERAQEVGHRRGAAACIEGIAAVLAAEERAADAARLLGAAEGIRSRAGASLAPFEHAIHERTLGLVERSLSDRDLPAALAAGRALSVDEAVETTLSLAADVQQPVAAAAEDAGPPPSGKRAKRR
jgi:predicted ATPase/DNA-binding SARP family transcriptional activator